MNKLWVRLGLAFAGVAMLAIAAVGLLANFQLRAGFHRYVISNQVDTLLIPALITYYQQRESWEGVAKVFERLPGPQRGKGRSSEHGHAPQYTLADASGRVVYDETGSAPARISTAQRRQAIPIVVNDQTVGYLMVIPGAGEGQGRAEAAFLDLITQSLLWAGVLAAILALILGFLVARQLSAPLSRLARAARALSQGDLSQRVPVSGSEEVSEVMAAFNEMAQELERSEALRRQMIADIAHELRTPLTVMQGNLQALLDGVYPLTKAEIAQVYDETLTLARLVNDLRALTQAEAGQLSLHPAEVDARALVAQAEAVFQDAAREKGIRLEADIAPALPAIWADIDRVRQVLYNLLSNALRHTPAGGWVRITARPASLPDGQVGVEIAVEDTGPGLTPEEQAHVFERFWRADASRSRDQGGSGLGLTIARHLIEAQGGVIGVASAPGQGARFWFTLPGVQPASNPASRNG
ncbi:MAG TPA: HAMP domain-containing protein [Anaerolineae bacterium]|nr:HAMP domain-containing protein [Anaerolineae bacterium]